jgi:hypothetical protein
MVERPIILFGKSQKAERSKRRGGPERFQAPSHSRQVERLAPKMNALQSAVAVLKQSPMGIESEKTLVFDVVGSADSFYTAVKNLGGDVEWIFDMPEDFAVSDDFYAVKENRETKEISRNEKKEVIGGKVYCVLSNVRAMEEMYSLWDRYSKDPSTKFPNGKTGLKDVFDNLSGMEFWGYKQRVEETGILEIWQEELADGNADTVKCEFELFYRQDASKRVKNEQELKRDLEALGGSVLGSSTIPEIAYHAVLSSIPRSVAESIIGGNQNVSITIAEQIMFFRPVGQAVAIPKDNSFDAEFQIPASDGIIDEPVVAIFDGMPQENHTFLQGRLVVDDPDSYSNGYVVEARKHGTAMASMVALGDLSNIEHTSTRKIYVRPIMKPIPWVNGDYLERIPDDNLLVDKIHIAVRRLFEGDGGGVAAGIKVINLSIGLGYRQFDRSMSPLARLLDWLSYKYNVLFIVSAGNHADSIDTGMTFGEFGAVDKESRDKAIITHINNEKRNLRLLSPAESINSLTIGSTFEDGTSFTENARQILPCSDGLPSPTSAIGMGMNSAIKPDIIFPGGRSWVRENILSSGVGTIVDWQDLPSREPGTTSAAPREKVMYTFGTSNSAALISHEAGRCYDTILDIFENAAEDVPLDYMALMIKAMLVHGAEWGVLTEKYAEVLGLHNKAGKISHQDCSRELHRYFGYGKPDINRAIECARNRIALIGYGELKNGEALTYNLPLPFNFSSSKICRRLTATLAYFSPTIPSRQKYRAAQCWYNIETGKPKFLDARMDADWQAAVRGSLQHEIFENDEIVVWDENESIQIKVNCRGDADAEFSGVIQYALMVSFEIKSGIDVDVYTRIAEKIHPKVSAN